MEIHDDSFGYFITWTVYGTFLQGDSRWWKKRSAGEQPPQPLLEQWHRDRLKHDVILLSDDHRKVVESEVEFHCQNRGWKLWVVNPRTNHVHVVVTAAGYTGEKVRDQLKANCTRGIREFDKRFVDRPVWTSKGDVRYLKTDEGLERSIIYAGEAQDRMGLHGGSVSDGDGVGLSGSPFESSPESMNPKKATLLKSQRKKAMDKNGRWPRKRSPVTLITGDHCVCF